MPATPPSPPLRVRTLGDILSAEYPPREYLLEPVLRQGESALVWAPTGIGKTMLTLTVALAVAGGGSFLDWTARKPRRVLIVDGEMAREDVQDRLRMLAGTIAGFDAEAAAGNLAVMARSDQTKGAKFPDIASEAGQKAVVAEAERHRAELIILDNFSTLADVVEENEAGAMNPVLTFLLALKADRLACILVHHSGKTGTTYRGSSKLATTFEVILGLTKRDDDGADTGARFSLQWDKFRGAPHPSLKPRDVTLEKHFDGVTWVAREAEADVVTRVLRALETGSYANQKEIAEALGLSEAKVSRAFTQAFAKSLLPKARRDEVFRAVEEARTAERAEKRAASGGGSDF